MKGLHKAVNVCQERIRRVAAILVGIFQVGYGFLQGVIVLVAQRIGDGGNRWQFCDRLCGLFQFCGLFWLLCRFGRFGWSGRFLLPKFIRLLDSASRQLRGGLFLLFRLHAGQLYQVLFLDFAVGILNDFLRPWGHIPCNLDFFLHGTG